MHIGHAAVPTRKVSGKRVELAVDGDHARDVADWGRTGRTSPVDLSASDDDAGVGAAPGSLSSGLSARDEQWGHEGRGGPRARPFAPTEGLASLVHHTKTYMASQALRKCVLTATCLRRMVNRSHFNPPCNCSGLYTGVRSKPSCFMVLCCLQAATQSGTDCMHCNFMQPLHLWTSCATQEYLSQVADGSCSAPHYGPVAAVPSIRNATAAP